MPIHSNVDLFSELRAFGRLLCGKVLLNNFEQYGAFSIFQF